MKKLSLKRTFALATSAIALTTAFVGCSDYSGVYSDEYINQITTKKEYYQNFVKEFGQPDPNHTWGWGMTREMADAILASNPPRLATRDVSDDYVVPGRTNVNRNEWCTKNNPYCWLNVYGVPGWPNDDGRYYEKIGSYNNGSYARYDVQPDNCNMPNGDVTEYEILYISNMVHELGPGIRDLSQKLHVSDFYIQDVSCNGDYSSEEQYKLGNCKDFTDGDHNYTTYQMDHLNCKSLGGSNTWTHINNDNAGMNEKPLLNVGNNSARNIIYVQSSGTEDFEYHPSHATNGDYYNKYVLVQFTWYEPKNPQWSLVGQNGKDIFYYLNQDHAAELDLNGEVVERTGYYICFDYKCIKTSESIDYPGDDIYDNWILKLSPGYPIMKNRWPKRIMCEDLGNTNDFDFNDAVFDLSFSQNVANSNAYDMVVTLRAAGGTMPIWVAIDPDHSYGGQNMEIHHLLGDYPVTTPVNVIPNGAKAAPVMYRIKNAFTFDHSQITNTHDYGYTDEHGNKILVPDYNSNDQLMAQMAAYAFTAKIYIQNIISGNSQWESVSGYDLQNGLREYYNEGNLSTNTFPQLFNCSTDAKWTYEHGHIKEAYSHFADWVQDEIGYYRLRWDEKEYFQRDGSGHTYIEKFSPEKISQWYGSWDFGPKTSAAWGSDASWIDKSKCYEGDK